MPGLLLNYFECDFSKTSLDLHFTKQLAYTTKEAYFDLRKANPAFRFYRFQNDIYYWTHDKTQSTNVPGSPVTVSIADFPGIFCKVFETVIIHEFEKLSQYHISRASHGNVWEITNKKNLLPSTIQGIELNWQIRFSSFYLKPGPKMLVGLLISSSLKPRFTWSNADFAAHSIDIRSLSVRDNRILPDRHSVKVFLDAMGLSSEYMRVFDFQNSPNQRHGTIDKFFSWLSKGAGKLAFPCGNTLSRVTKSLLPMFGNLVKSERLPTPIRCYYAKPAADNTRSLYHEMLKALKPFSFGVFENKPISIGFLTPKEHEGIAESFVPLLRAKLKEYFHLDNIAFPFRLFDGSTKQDYQTSMYAGSFFKADLVIVVVTEDHLRLPIGDSPYLLCKAKFIGQGIPTQEIQVRNLKRPNDFILNNVALNIYAKLGGTAWTIEKEEKEKEELIVGIGSTIAPSGDRVMGIAQIFNADGQYIVGDCVPLSGFLEYQSRLKEFLIASLKSVFSNKASSGKGYRLIFHLFKEAGKHYELPAISSALEEFKEVSITFAIAHLSYGHNFRLFFNEGKSQVSKGTYIKLDSNLSLLHFVQNSSTPLLIRLDRRSTFKDLYYIAKQVYGFSHLSYRSFIPAKKTVTIMYPSLMAGLTEKMKDIPGWDYDQLKLVSEKLWFI